MRINEIHIFKIYKEAMISSEVSQWKKATDKKIDDIRDQNVYTLIFKSIRTEVKIKVLQDKWIFLVKLDKFDKIEHYKACWIVQEFQQQKSINYNQIYASVVAGFTIHTIFTVITVQNWHMKQINFITAFLNESLLKTVYMIQSINYKEDSNLICKLNQDLYDLKQSSRIWYKILTNFLQELDFTSSK